MILINDVSLTIKDKKILSDIDLHIEKGEVVGLIGRNGSGKTMLMKCICGFIPVTSGTIKVNDKRVGVDVDFPDNLGIIIENPGFVNAYTGYKNLKILASYRKKIGKEKILDTLKAVGMYDARNMMVAKYSLGMRQRLGLAQAIMEDPDILILDEPMNGLDYEGVDSVRKILLEIKKSGKTIVIASHNKDDIDILCDHVYEMNKGCMEKIR